MHENEISERVIGLAMKVHSRLGPGLLESAYEAPLAYELEKSHLQFFRQKPQPLVYEEISMDVGYRLDFLVESKVIVEVKAVDQLAPIHLAQMITYLRLTGCKLGLLINFNVVHLKDGVRRVVNGL